MIDVPQIAYKTWNIMVVDKKTGKRLIDAEKELEKDLRKYEYSRTNEHVR